MPRTTPNLVQFRNESRDGSPVVRARWCEGFFCRLAGFTFRSSILSGQGLILADQSESRMNASIHMWFVFMDLGVAWLDEELTVVDTVLARPWRIYVPSSPARYILESGPELLESLAVGDELAFENVSS